ncbi:MAG TPA: hypothetical protein VFU40_05370 [Gemmatimonadales bacterium]|nr:hypothetical protein [Gemmatimonadales bacterium]
MIARRFVMTVTALLLSCASVVATAGIAAGQNAVLYEVTEQMKVKRNDTVRAATSSLMGSISAGTSLCPDWLVAALKVGRCSISATASDTINLSTGQGPVSGRFSILIPGDNPMDGPELVIAEGSLRGMIDLSPAVIGWNGVRIPLGRMAGEWSARGSRGGPLDGLRVEGTLTGTFRLPFADPWLGAAYMLNPYAYPAEGTAVGITKDELSLGVPAVRLELDFVEANSSAARGWD